MLDTIYFFEIKLNRVNLELYVPKKFISFLNLNFNINSKKNKIFIKIFLFMNFLMFRKYYM